MPDHLDAYAWREVTLEQRAAAERLIEAGLAAPLPLGEQRCRVRLDLRRRQRDGGGDRYFIDRDGSTVIGYVLKK